MMTSRNLHLLILAGLLATANVMAPLNLDAGPSGAWDSFQTQLKAAR